MGFISPVAVDASGAQRQTGGLQTLGKDDFLQLLVTKLQHQDPLKPMDDEDFIAQLAQFSSLEQMNNIARGIETSNKWDFLQMQSLNNVMASGLIGREVTADFSGVYMDATSEPMISYTLTQPASEIEFQIRDEQGKLITTLTAENLEVGTGSIKWDGTNTAGNRVAEGYYTVTVSATAPSGANFTPSLELVGVVTTITYRDGAAFVMVNGTEVSLGDIRSVGQPREEQE
jgi:flagellar basal-body rod modification protein FlgD